MSIIFASPALGIMVVQQHDGSQSVAGQYNGVAIKSAVPVDGGSHCILLLDPDISHLSAFENLLCINWNGRVIWTAKLPDTFDAFVAVSVKEEGVWANTWSGLMVLLDKRSGAELKRAFLK